MVVLERPLTQTQVAVYLAFAVDKASDYWSVACSWHASKELIRNTFGRKRSRWFGTTQKTNPFSDSTGNISSAFEWAEKAMIMYPFYT